MSYSLEHHGIVGQKWGVRRGPPYPLNDEQKMGRSRIKKSRSSNMDKWGKDKNHNICYITGLSGSGKSTVARSIADDKTDVIHLDAYYGNAIEKTNKNFDQYLRSINVKSPRNVKDWNGTNTLGEFENAVDSFGKIQFKKGRKVIAEGIEVYNKTLWEDSKHYNDKPMIIISTPMLESLYRVIQRTSKYENVSFIDAIGGIKGAEQQVKGYFQNSKTLNDFSSANNVKKGEKWVKEFLSNTR